MAGSFTNNPTRSFTITQSGESRSFSINTGVGPTGAAAPTTGIDPTAITGTAVTISGTQTISGLKTFTAGLKIGTHTFTSDGTDDHAIVIPDLAGDLFLSTSFGAFGLTLASTAAADDALTELGAGAEGKLLLATTTSSAARTELGAGATGDALFTAATVQNARTGLGETYYRAVGQNFATASMADVTGFSQNLDADSNYKIEGQIYYSSDAGGIAVGWLTTALETGAAGNARCFAFGPTGTLNVTGYGGSFANMQMIYNEAAARSNRPIMFTMMIRTNSSGGNIKLRAQKSTTSGSSTDTVILPLTWASITKIPV